MLGVIIGVASVVVARRRRPGRHERRHQAAPGPGHEPADGQPGATTTGFTRGAAGSANTLTIDDAEAIAALTGRRGRRARDLDQPVRRGRHPEHDDVDHRHDRRPTRPSATTTSGRARPSTSAAVDASLHEAVLGATTADDLGLTASSIGATITIGGLPFQVVGILQAKGSTGPVSQDDQILIPYTDDRRPSSSPATRSARSGSASPRPTRSTRSRPRSRPCSRPATTSPSAGPTTSRSPTRPSC